MSNGEELPRPAAPPRKAEGGPVVSAEMAEQFLAWTKAEGVNLSGGTGCWPGEQGGAGAGDFRN